jgi:hypothetical protein
LQIGMCLCNRAFGFRDLCVQDLKLLFCRRNARPCRADRGCCLHRSIYT